MAHITSTDDGLRELALFAGAGGGILGGMLLGWRTVCAVEIEPYPVGVLIQRQNDGILPPFPIWDDVCTFDGKSWRGIVDVVSGGFPCQDISAAGKGAGITGERSGLWKEFARIIGEVRPRFCFVENSPILTSRGLDVVLGNLAEMGYDARWGVVSAADAGAPHLRERIWILAYSDVQHGKRRAESRKPDGGSRAAWSEPIGLCPDVADIPAALQGHAFSTNTDSKRPYRENTNPTGQGGEIQPRDEQERFSGSVCEDVANAASVGQPRPREYARRCGDTPDRNGKADWPINISKTGSGPWEFEPDVGRVANGVAARVDRLKAIGNGQCPQAMALAWNILSEGLI